MTPRMVWTLFVRSFFLQATFNHMSLLGAGFGWVLLPVRRAGDEAEGGGVETDIEPFNSHPYLAGVAVGAVARARAEGVPPEKIARFKGAVRGSLGGLGDRLVWTSVRPTLLLFALAGWAMDLDPWLIVLGFLILYNVVHVGLRMWGLRLGVAEGLGVARRLGGADLGGWAERIVPVGCVALGLFCGILASGPISLGTRGWIWAGAALVAFVYGLRRGVQVLRPTRAAVALVVLVLALMGFVA